MQNYVEFFAQYSEFASTFQFFFITLIRCTEKIKDLNIPTKTNLHELQRLIKLINKQFMYDGKNFDSLIYYSVKRSVPNDNDDGRGHDRWRGHTGISYLAVVTDTLNYATMLLHEFYLASDGSKSFLKKRKLKVRFGTETKSSSFIRKQYKSKCVKIVAQNVGRPFFS